MERRKQRPDALGAVRGQLPSFRGATDNADKKVDAFVSRLQSDGFVVNEGRVGLFDYVTKCCEVGAQIAVCSFFNAASPHFAACLRPSPGQATLEPWFTRDPQDTSRSVAWHLRPDEAVVLVGLTPPPMRYFGLQTYRWVTVDEKLGPVRKWNNFGDQTNQLVVNSADTPNGTPGDPFNSEFIYILTADQSIDARMREAARRAGYPASIMNTKPIPQSIIRVGLDEAKLQQRLRRIGNEIEHKQREGGIEARIREIQLLRVANLEAGSIGERIPASGVSDIFLGRVDPQDARAALAFRDRKRQ